MLTDEPKRPTAHQVQTPQVLIRSPNMSYDLQTTNLADIHPPPDMVKVDIPEEEPECDPPGTEYYTHPVTEAPINYSPSLNCYDDHHATSKKTSMNRFNVSLPAAPSQMNEGLNQVSRLHICDITHQHQHLN